MRTKLSTLQTHPAELSSAAANDNPLSADLLRSLSVALSDRLSLSTRCHNPNPPGGKLMKQNDTDSLSAKINSLSRDLEVLIKSGVLCENSAISEDDKNVLIAVAQRVVPVLVTLLDSASSPDIKEKTVTALPKISTVDSDKLPQQQAAVTIVQVSSGAEPAIAIGDE
nr:vacuolar protein 8 [Ipomoea batatas]